MSNNKIKSRHIRQAVSTQTTKPAHMWQSQIKYASKQESVAGLADMFFINQPSSERETCTKDCKEQLTQKSSFREYKNMYQFLIAIASKQNVYVKADFTVRISHVYLFHVRENTTDAHTCCR